MVELVQQLSCPYLYQCTAVKQIVCRNILSQYHRRSPSWNAVQDVFKSNLQNLERRQMLEDTWREGGKLVVVKIPAWDWVKNIF